MLAFIHIEKSAGTTFKSILQRNYGAGFCDVRPLFGPSDKQFDPPARESYVEIVRNGGNPSQFGPRDLKAYRQLAPWIHCVAGHSLRPCLGLEKAVAELQYVTILREPVSRYVSYYTYGTGTPRRPWNFSFEEYLSKPNFHNFQTKKIACRADIEAAKAILDKQFMMVGIMEEFDEFLCLLKRKIEPASFDISYQSLNTMRDRQKIDLTEFSEIIRQNNRVDLELYAYVKETILPRQRAEYGADLRDVVASFKITNENRKTELSMRSFVKKLVQRMYIDVAVGIMRRLSGLSWSGPY